MTPIAIFPLSLLVAIGTGCNSVDRELAKQLSDGQFDAARAILEEYEVGAIPSPSASPEALALRAQFTNAIESDSQQKVAALLESGQARQAHELACVRQQFCPWSDILKAMVADCEALLRRIRDTEKRWSPAFEQSPSVSQAREFLTEIASHGPWMMDSPLLRSLESSAKSKLMRHWTDEIEAQGGRLGSEDRMLLDADLASCKIAEEDCRRLDEVLAITSGLPSQLHARSPHSTDWLSLVARARQLTSSSAPPTSGAPVSPLIGAAWSAFGRWYRGPFTTLLASGDVSYELIAEAEAWQETGHATFSVSKELAMAHISLAARQAPLGLSAPLALVHLQRARALGVPSGDPEIAQVTNIALAARTNQSRVAYRLLVEIEPEVHPEIQAILQRALLVGLEAKSGQLAELDYRCSDVSRPALAVRVHSAQRLAEAFDEKTITSAYYSHHETVANPAKQSLASQLNAAEATVELREQAYDSAVKLHNIYRTIYSLANANSAYSSYMQSIDQYNLLVSQYNAAPSTIERAVYLPYTFEEGKVRFGWRVVASAAIEGLSSIDVRAESVAEDFVRLGTKATDRESKFRRDDRIDIDISWESSLEHLGRVVEQVRARLNEPLCELGRGLIPGITEEEKRILGWMCHPWGLQPELASGCGVPAWAAAAATAVSFEHDPVSPAVVRTGSPRHLAKKGLSPEDAGTLLSKFVCMIESGTEERVLSRGSGTLIGENGLILTCAHVLVGSRCVVRFSEGAWAGVHDAEVVFANSQKDVALLRARSIANQDWVAVRLDGDIAAGESIVTIGNPAMDIGGVNVGGISSGVVSNPALQRQGTTYLAIDAAIASGSSGGPVFSLRDGALIGVVQLVATAPGFPQRPGEVAASGFLCLSAPSTMLDDWLGLR